MTTSADVNVPASGSVPVYKRKRRSCGICKPGKRGLAKCDRKGKGTTRATRQDDRLAVKRALSGDGYAY